MIKKKKLKLLVRQNKWLDCEDSILTYPLWPNGRLDRLCPNSSVPFATTNAAYRIMSIVL